MPKVLQLKKQRKETLATSSGAEYEFIGPPISPKVNFMQVIMNDNHANELLEKYPELVKEVPKKDYPEHYIKKIDEYRRTSIEDAIKDKPVLKEFVPDKYKEKKEDKPISTGKTSTKK